MQTARIFVSPLAELSACVQVRQDQLDCRHFPFRMDINRNASSVVPHRDAAVYMNVYVNLVAVTGEMFVNRIIENFENQVMQTALIRVSDVHARPLPDGFQPFELVDLSRIVLLRFIDVGRVALTIFLADIFVVLIGGDGGSGRHRKKVATKAHKTTNNLVVSNALFALPVGASRPVRPTILWLPSRHRFSFFLHS